MQLHRLRNPQEVDLAEDIASISELSNALKDRSREERNEVYRRVSDKLITIIRKVRESCETEDDQKASPASTVWVDVNLFQRALSSLTVEQKWKFVNQSQRDIRQSHHHQEACWIHAADDNIPYRQWEQRSKISHRTR